jgi:FixJ family two-component response regulator
VAAENPCTIIVVDDDESVRRALKRLLSSSGYQVVTFESAEELLHSGFLQAAHCFVLDIRLPGVSGLDLYEDLIPSEAKRPVIFMTAHENPEWEQRAIRTGAIAYLRKPFDQQALLHAVDRACRERREANYALESAQ